MEPIYQQRFQINDAAVDCFGRLKPSMLLLYAQEVAGHHSDLLHFTYDTLASKGLFWAVIRNRVQITRLPREHETITIETWPMPTTRTAYPRATVGYDADGKELFRVMGIWVLMNLKTRAMVLPGKSGIDVPGIQRENTPPAPRSLSPIREEGRCRRQVSQEDLDKNNHMNNVRYVDMFTDYIPGSLKGQRIVSLDISYICKQFNLFSVKRYIFLSL